MAKQTINPGVAPTGAGGDTFRSGSAKLQANDDEIYNYLGDGTNLNKLGTAAFKNTGTQAGNVMEVGAFGLGSNNLPTFPTNIAEQKTTRSGFYYTASGSDEFTDGQLIYINRGYWLKGIHFAVGDTAPRLIQSNKDRSEWSVNQFLINGINAWVDANGFVKAASPIVKLFAEKIELNDEAKQQEITFEKLGVGDYLIKGSTGFAQEGWYVETPKDANGNLLVALVYEQLVNGDISVKTYDYMLNKKGRIVADTETPLDIPENRWIDIRLQELPQPKIEVTDDPEQ